MTQLDWFALFMFVGILAILSLIWRIDTVPIRNLMTHNTSAIIEVTNF